MLSGIFKKSTKVGKILVVDDEPGVVMIMSKVLKHNGYKVITASDGIECIAKAENELPDLILLDNTMPNMDGPTALGKLKASQKTKGIPVIVVTAYGSEENIAKAQKGGAATYIVKPFDYSVLLERISQVLKSERN